MRCHIYLYVKKNIANANSTNFLSNDQCQSFGFLTVNFLDNNISIVQAPTGTLGAAGARRSDTSVKRFGSRPSMIFNNHTTTFKLKYGESINLSRQKKVLFCCQIGFKFSEK